jgi:polyhydroxyalkanoate synthesis regulator phasin
MNTDFLNFLHALAGQVNKGEISMEEAKQYVGLMARRFYDSPAAQNYEAATKKDADAKP